MACSMGMALAKKAEADKRKKKWAGGDIYDNIGENSHPKDTAGEPHTEDYEEKEQPMEFMAEGGIVDEPAYKMKKGSEPGVSVENEPRKRIERDANAASDAGEMDGYNADEEPVSLYHAGGEAKHREKIRFQQAAKMLDGGEVTSPQPKQPGVGKGGGLKGAFEHDDKDEDSIKKYESLVTDSYFAGGSAGEKEDYSDEEMPRMMAGGEAALPEKRDPQEDPGVDPDASFVADFLKARKAMARSPGR